MIFSQIFDILDIGIVILDSDLRVYKWNRWMELHSGIQSEQIVGCPLFDFFPQLNNPRFMKSCKCVLGLGNLYFFSQKLHRYLFPFKPVSAIKSRFEYMQQYCNMGPLRSENNTIDYIYITVRDVTEIAIYEQKLIEMNMKDGLTGIYNRRYFEGRIKEEFDRNKRYGQSFSLCMFDLDHFKRINDTCGHLYGDSVLQSVAEMITATIRTSDILVRYGGEEFCLMLPETGLENAAATAERCRAAIEGYAFMHQNERLRITISLGVAELTDNIVSPESLIEKADQALYEAKKAGRNRVVMAMSG